MSTGEPIRLGRHEAVLDRAETAADRRSVDGGGRRRGSSSAPTFCAVPAGGVVGEAVVAFELANAVLEKFGGDSLGETAGNQLRGRADGGGGERGGAWWACRAPARPWWAASWPERSAFRSSTSTPRSSANGQAGVPDLRRGRRGGLRALEAAALVRASSSDPSVVSCGGGVVLKPANRITLRNTGTAVYLDVPIDQLRARVRRGGRPPPDPRGGRISNDCWRRAGRSIVSSRRTWSMAVRNRARSPTRSSADSLVRVSVQPGRAYDVVVGRGVIEEAGVRLPELPKAETAFVVADRGVADRWFEPLSGGLRSRGWTCTLLTVAPGEDAKTLEVYRALLHQLAQRRKAHRDDVVVALGGGSVGDYSPASLPRPTCEVCRSCRCRPRSRRRWTRRWMAKPP